MTGKNEIEKREEGEKIISIKRSDRNQWECNDPVMVEGCRMPKRKWAVCLRCGGRTLDLENPYIRWVCSCIFHLSCSVKLKWTVSCILGFFLWQMATLHICPERFVGRDEGECVWGVGLGKAVLSTNGFLSHFRYALVNVHESDRAECTNGRKGVGTAVGLTLSRLYSAVINRDTSHRFPFSFFLLVFVLREFSFRIMRITCSLCTGLCFWSFHQKKKTQRIEQVSSKWR